MRPDINKVIFIIGFILSPISWWNDIFINIPISYAVASSIHYFVKLPFIWLTLACYWLSNILGLLMMFVSARDSIYRSENKLRSIFDLVLVTVFFSLVLFVLERSGALLPAEKAFMILH